MSWLNICSEHIEIMYALVWQFFNTLLPGMSLALALLFFLFFPVTTYVNIYQVIKVAMFAIFFENREE